MAGFHEKMNNALRKNYILGGKRNEKSLYKDSVCGSRGASCTIIIDRWISRLWTESIP